MHKGYFLGGLLIFIIFLFLYVYPNSIYEYSIRKKLHTIFHQEIRNYDHIELILKKIEKISKTLKPIISQKKAFDKEELRTEYLNNLLQYYIIILTDLRSDLALRLTEQKSTLERAKSEVEKNITGTPELLAVSELQKARLDRQIDQFEELQRVLVRI